jgi:hypothetical protein
MDNLNCRPGDLAVTVTATNAENIGVLVEVIGPADATRWPLADETGLLWWVRAVGRPMAYVFDDGHVEHLYAGPVPDRCLRPIRGPGDRPLDLMNLPFDPAAELERSARERYPDLFPTTTAEG